MIPGHVTDPEAIRRIVGGPLQDSPLPPSRNCTLAECEDCRQPMWIDSGHRQLIAEFEVTELEFGMICTRCMHDLEPHNEVVVLDSCNEASKLSLMRGAQARQAFTIVTMEELDVIRREYPDVFALPLRWP